jgi:SAM-dependent methyltransferase
MTASKAILNSVHERLVFGRRVEVLSRTLATQIDDDATVLDVGCGDGSVDLAILALKPRIQIEGIDVFVRTNAKFKTTVFDGRQLPFPNKHFDYVMFVDVLHHTNDPEILLREAARVARRGVIIKDHLREGLLAGPTLRFMDWIGNHGHDVTLPYNYLRLPVWHDLFKKAKLSIDTWTERLGLYAAPLSWFFERRLHFIARLGVAP